MEQIPWTLSALEAQKFVADDGDVDIWGYELMSDEAAEILSNYEGSLSFSGLTKISQVTAKSLSRSRGRELNLQGLKNLSLEVAEHLSNYKGILELSGLTELSDSAAHSLSKHQGHLLLSGLLP
jgi:hypothetical protein